MHHESLRIGHYLHFGRRKAVVLEGSNPACPCECIRVRENPLLSRELVECDPFPFGKWMGGSRINDEFVVDQMFFNKVIIGGWRQAAHDYVVFTVSQCCEQCVVSPS